MAATPAARIRSMKNAVAKVGFEPEHKAWLNRNVSRGQRNGVGRTTYIVVNGHPTGVVYYGLAGIEAALLHVFPGRFNSLNPTLFRCVIAHFFTADPDGPKWAPLGPTADRPRKKGTAQIFLHTSKAKPPAPAETVEGLAVAELKRRLRKMTTTQLARLARGK